MHQPGIERQSSETFQYTKVNLGNTESGLKDNTQRRSVFWYCKLKELQMTLVIRGGAFLRIAV